MILIKSLIVFYFVIISSCGIKGPPLPPVHDIPKSPALVEASQPNVSAPEAIKTIKKKKKTK